MNKEDKIIFEKMFKLLIECVFGPDPERFIMDSKANKLCKFYKEIEIWKEKTNV